MVPVIVVGAVTVAAGFIINYAVESADKALGRLATGNTKSGDGLSTAITPYLGDACCGGDGDRGGDSWDDLEGFHVFSKRDGSGRRCFGHTSTCRN